MIQMCFISLFIDMRTVSTIRMDHLGASSPVEMAQALASRSFEPFSTQRLIPF